MNKNLFKATVALLTCVSLSACKSGQQYPVGVDEVDASDTPETPDGSVDPGGLADAEVLPPEEVDSGVVPDPVVMCAATEHLCPGMVCQSNASPQSCGTSCTPCQAPEGGFATCDGTICGADCTSADQELCAGKCIDKGAACEGKCEAGTHACGGLCSADTDVNKCGPECKTCAPPASNGVAMCAQDKCDVKCNDGFRKCPGTSSCQECCGGADCSGAKPTCGAQGKCCPAVPAGCTQAGAMYCTANGAPSVATCGMDANGCLVQTAVQGCPAPTNGTATCAAAACGKSCGGNTLCGDGVCRKECPTFLIVTGADGFSNGCAQDVNADGSVVVGVLFASGAGGDEGFIWDKKKATPLSYLSEGAGLGVSPGGTFIAGYVYDSVFNPNGPPDLRAVAAFWNPNSQRLSWPAHSTQGFRGTAASDSGKVFASSDHEGQFPGDARRSFVWSVASGHSEIPLRQVTDVSADGRVVAGQRVVDGVHVAAILVDGVVKDVPVPGPSRATSVSHDGLVVVGESQNRAFRWVRTQAAAATFSMTGANRLGAYGTNADGSVFVGSSDVGAIYWASSYATNDVKKLSDILTGAGVNLSSWKLSNANGVSADGKIVVGCVDRFGEGVEPFRAVVP